VLACSLSLKASITWPWRADLPCITLHCDLMCKQPFPLCLQFFFPALCPCLVVASHGYNHLSLPCTSLDPGRINTRVFQRVGAVALFFRSPAFHESESWNSSIWKMKFDFDRTAPRTSVVYDFDLASLDRENWASLDRCFISPEGE
jgi:hypothetical protein